MSTYQAGQFIVAENGQNGASVSAWLASRFTGGIPVAQDTALPSGSPDAGPVTTGVGYGGPGFWLLDLPTSSDYVIAIQWAGHIYYTPWSPPGAGAGLPSWMQYGSGSPVGSVVPYAQGSVYWDMTAGASYIAIGPLDTNWVATGGNGDTTVPGLTISAVLSQLLAAASGQVSLSDVAATLGSGNGIFHVANGTDGQQYVFLQVGASGLPFDVPLQSFGNGAAGGLGLYDSLTAGTVNLFVAGGSPVGVITPQEVGDVCFDGGTPAIWQATGLADTDWTQVGASAVVPIQHGAGTPLGSVAPTATGYLYRDTTNGALYVALGTSNADWVICGGQQDVGVGGVPIGVLVQTGLPTYGALVALVGGDSNIAMLTDNLALFPGNSMNGVQWIGDGTDGEQYLRIQVGPNGSGFVLRFNNNGSFQLPLSLGLGITAPTEYGVFATNPGPDPASTTAALTSVAVGSAWQNTLDYDVLVTVTLVVTAATGASLAAGVDSSDTPTTVPVVGSFSTATAAVIPLSFKVPAGQYLEIDSSGTITIASTTTWAQAA